MKHRDKNCHWQQHFKRKLRPLSREASKWSNESVYDPHSANDVEVLNNFSNVLDGGALHHVLSMGKTFGEVTELYRVYVSKCTRVFDCYQENKLKITNTIKDHCSTRHALTLHLMLKQMPWYLNTCFLLIIETRKKFVSL